MKYGSMFYPNKEALFNLSRFDIRVWIKFNYLHNDGKCPTCNVDFFDMHPDTNMYPHWKGECKKC